MIDKAMKQATSIWCDITDDDGEIRSREYAVRKIGEALDEAWAAADVRGGEWCAKNRAEGRGPCGACAWCCQQERERAERAEAALSFYADEKTYLREPYVRVCDSSWHDEAHSYHSRCYMCGGAEGQRKPVDDLHPEPIEERGALAREVLARRSPR